MSKVADLEKDVSLRIEYPIMKKDSLRVQSYVNASFSPKGKRFVSLVMLSYSTL